MAAWQAMRYCRRPTCLPVYHHPLCSYEKDTGLFRRTVWNINIGLSNFAFTFDPSWSQRSGKWKSLVSSERLFAGHGCLWTKMFTFARWIKVHYLCAKFNLPYTGNSISASSPTPAHLFLTWSCLDRCTMVKIPKIPQHMHNMHKASVLVWPTTPQKIILWKYIMWSKKSHL